MEESRSDALHALSLVELHWSDSTGRALNRAIDNLHSVARLAESPASGLADLSAAYLLRAQATQNPLDLFRAAEASEDALAAEPADPIARFNRALALSWLGLQDQALFAWSEYLLVDSVSGWAAGGRRLRDSLAVIAPLPLPRSARADAWVDYAARAPQEARLLALNTILREWGEAVLGGHASLAANRLQRARVIGDALTRGGGDGAVADAVGAIDACANDPDLLRALARGHVEYGRGQAALDAKRYADALKSFERALAESAMSRALNQWAAFFRGVALFFHGRNTAAMQVFDTLAPRVDTLRHPALAGRVRWSRGTILLRAGHYLESLSETRQAIRHFGRIGERENLGAMLSQASEAEFALGDDTGAYASIHAALLTLRPYRYSVRLHNHLFVTTLAAGATGFVRVAVRVQDEGVATAARIDPRLYAEALLARARALTRARDSAGAARDVNAATALVNGFPSGYERSWYEQDVRLAAAGILVRTQPESAVAALTEVVEFFSGTGNVLRRLPALVHRSEAWLALGNARRATDDLNRATALLDSLSAIVRDAALRASMLEAARGVFDGLVMLHVAENRDREALLALERGRASVARTQGERSPRAPRQTVAPAGQVVLDYALIGDTLLTWRVGGDSVHLHRQTVGRAALLRTIEEVRVALERRAGMTSFQSQLTALHDWLIRPVGERIRTGTPLVLVADGELLAVPFAALFDARRGRHLIEDHLIRISSSLRDASHRLSGGLTPNGTALFVVDPLPASAEYPGLEPLSRAADEVREMASMYLRSQLLIGAQASHAGLRAALPRASLFYFGGHGVFDDEQPARSFLLLHGSGESARLTATELAEMPFGKVQLVILAACQTQRSRAGRTGGLSGLSGAILRAGAQGVVGSLWRVDDESTRALMMELVAVYREGASGAAALRAAQLRLLRSGDGALNSPAAWAGFHYMGG